MKKHLLNSIGPNQYHIPFGRVILIWLTIIKIKYKAYIATNAKISIILIFIPLRDEGTTLAQIEGIAIYAMITDIRMILSILE